VGGVGNSQKHPYTAKTAGKNRAREAKWKKSNKRFAGPDFEVKNNCRTNYCSTKKNRAQPEGEQTNS